MSLNKSEILHITPAKGVFLDGPRNEGYSVCHPYVEHNLIERVLREICFRCLWLPHKMWFNKAVKKAKAKYIIVFDPLITTEYLKWLQCQFSHAQLNFVYGNMVGKANHILPHEIPQGWRVWTYDDYDSKKYGLRLFHENGYFKSYVRAKEDSIYDVVFVGCDKGRGEYLLELQKRMNSEGLRTKFVIVADGRLSKRKPYYHKALEYDEIVDLIVRSRAILNVAMPNQQGITMRDLESIFFNVKLITTNRNIVNTDIYNPQNVFILDGLNIEGLKAFMENETCPVPDEIKEKHSYDHFIEIIIG